MDVITDSIDTIRYAGGASPPRAIQGVHSFFREISHLRKSHNPNEKRELIANSRALADFAEFFVTLCSHFHLSVRKFSLCGFPNVYHFISQIINYI